MRDRVRELRRVRASELRANPRNWRTHPDHQRAALRGVLEEIGFADALIAFENDDGDLEIIDGHLRQEMTGDREVPVLILDVDQNEANVLLATLDPIGAMAGKDKDMLEQLLEETHFNDDQILETVHGVGKSPYDSMRKMDQKPLPEMSWVLIGVPIDEHEEMVGAIGDLPREAIIRYTVSNELL